MSDLIRHLRHGGPRALAAAKELLEGKPKLTAAEVAEVKLLLPQLKDLFGMKLAEGLSTLLSGHEVILPVPLETLVPHLEQLKDVKQLPARFTTDLQLVRPQLVNHPALTREQKATRLFAFLVPFLTKLVKSPAAQREEVAPKLLERASEAGFAQLEDKPTKRDGVQVAKQLLQAPTPEQMHEEAKALQLDAPGWPETPAPKVETQQPPQQQQQRGAEQQQRAGEATRAPEVARSPEEVRAREAGDIPRSDEPRTSADAQKPSAAQSSSAQAERLREREAAAQAERAASRTNKRLGPQMLWNVLHLFRDDGAQGRDSAAQRDELNRLIIGMAVAIGFLTLIAVLVFALR